MSDRVLVSTHDLVRAGELRSAFQGAGLDATLITPDHELGPTDGAGLIVLTGGVDSPEGVALLEHAAALEVPVIGYGSGGGEPVLDPGHGISELFHPGADPEEVALVGTRIMQRRELQALTGIVGDTDAMREVLERVVQIAPVPSTVLVTGESGTGKELVARGIHGLSPRRHRPFIAVNVAALSETLLESELFGHEKGAFTGAIDARRGLFELADRGTIFLDEIGEMPLSTQTKLLRVLEQQEFHRVGGEKSIRVDVRIIAATNQDLRRLVAIREFRQDLYYRLNVLHIELPPLRRRREDIPRLVRAFVEEISESHDRSFPGISSEAMEILVEHSWPGNVRELRNLVESMVVLAPGGEIQPSDIPPEVTGESRGTALVPSERTAPSETGAVDPNLRPQLEFVFRTLVDLRVDVDDLRKEFQAYVEEAGHAGRVPTRSEIRIAPPGLDVYESTTDPHLGDLVEVTGDFVNRDGERGEDDPPSATIVFRPGMTMEDLEREAIVTVLREVGGNRRKAAERLAIGERTLYRKLRKYELEEGG